MGALDTLSRFWAVRVLIQGWEDPRRTHLSGKALSQHRDKKERSFGFGVEGGAWVGTREKSKLPLRTDPHGSPPPATAMHAAVT